MHNVVPKKQVLPRIQQLLEVVDLNPEHYNRYPSEFSGGQRQRIGIARALTLPAPLLRSGRAGLALDLSIQAQVVNLLQDLRRSSTSPSSSSPTTWRWCRTSAPT